MRLPHPTLLGAIVVVALITTAWPFRHAVAQPTLKDAVGRLLDGPAAEPPTDGAAEASSAPATPSVNADDLHRETPRTAVIGFLDAARADDFSRAAEYLFLGSLPKGWSAEDGPQLARHLKTVLDRTLWVDIPLLSKEPEGHANDGLPVGRDLVGRIQTASGPVDVLVQRVRLPGGERVWKFASVTVARIPDLYEEFGDGPLAGLLPAMFFEIHLFDLQLWQVVGIAVAFLVAYLVALVVTAALGWLFRRLPDKLTTRLSPFITGPLRLLLTVVLFSAARLSLHLPLYAVSVVRALEELLRVFAFTWAGLRLLDVVATQLMDRLVERRQASAIGLLPPVRRVLQILIVMVGTVVSLSAIGFNVTALVAGLGVGGIAVALAAQKSIEHLFGGVTLYADQPVKVGDSCRFGDKVGTVEVIGLRSTRVRTQERTVLTIPNAEFASLQIENFAKRDKFWFHPRLSLRYETTPDQMRYVLIEVRQLLYQHPKVDRDPCRVRFTTFSASSLDIDISAYVLAADANEFLAIAEDLNLRLMEIVGQAGANFAFPSQTLYLEQGAPPDPQRVAEAEAAVHRWRKEESLYITDFPADKIDAMYNTLEYPPKGAPDTRAPSA